VTLACIIPVRNMAATVGRAIESAFAAGCDDVVVVDDCSTDDTPSVLADFGDRITVWRWPRKPSDWVAAQRVVWDATKADHYTWLGADDYLMPCFGDVVRKHADAGVVFTDYAVVTPDDRQLWTVSQEVTQPTPLTGDEMRARIQSDRNATETGSGSSLRADVARWLWASGFDAMGPHADSIGYATAAATFGCALVPVIGAAFRLTETSYSRPATQTQEQIVERGTTCVHWMRSVGLDEQTTRALAKKRCRISW